MAKIRYFINKIRNEENVNLILPLFLIFISIVIISIPGSYIAYNLFSTIPNQKFKTIISILGLATPFFIAFFGLVGWIIIMGIYYQIIRLFLETIGFEFRKFLYIAGYLFPVKALIILTLTLTFFKVYGFSGFQPGMTAKEIESFFIAWNTAKSRIEIFSSYLYLSLLALSISTAYGESKKKILLIFLIPYTTWIVFTALLRSLIS